MSKSKATRPYTLQIAPHPAEQSFQGHKNMFGLTELFKSWFESPPFQEERCGLKCTFKLKVSLTKKKSKPEKFIYLARGSVLDFTDGKAGKKMAIVNAANESCINGGGVDGAITRAGGPELRKAREKLPLVAGNTRCWTGDAKITVGGSLKVEYCIHAVGPCYQDYSMGKEPQKYTKDQMDVLLYKAYSNALQRAEENKIEKVAFSLISAGLFRGGRSLQRLLGIAVDAVGDSLQKKSAKYVKEVYLVAYKPDEFDELKKSMKLKAYNFSKALRGRPEPDRYIEMEERREERKRELEAKRKAKLSQSRGAEEDSSGNIKNEES